MTRTTLARGAAALTGATLALGLGLVAPAAHAAPIPAVAGADPAPAVAGAAYLVRQPEANNIVKTYYEFPAGNFVEQDDYGLTVDVATALDAVGGNEAKAAAMTAAVRGSVDTWVATAFNAAGARAKALSFLTSRGQTGTDIDDLEADLEADVTPNGNNAGRLAGASTLTQAFAADGLNGSGSDLAAKARAFLLKQQCDSGGFRSGFAPQGDAEQQCTTGTGDVDTTAFAVLLLQDQKSRTGVATAIEKASAWLATRQAADGSFSSAFSGANANSTGLAGWALGVSGRPAPAAGSASWLRARQLANAGTCVKYAAPDNGGIAVDDLGLSTAASGPLNDIDNDGFTRATAQALPALLWASGGAAAGDTKLTGPAEFVPAGSAQSVKVASAPGNTVCVSVTGAATSRVVLPATGETTVPVTLPVATTTKVTVSTVDAGGETDTLSFTGLAAAKLKAKGPKKVELGKKFKVKVTGLAPGEDVTVKYRGKTKKAEANAKGNAKVKLKAKKLGKSKVKFTGELDSRKGKKTVRVTR